MIAGTPFSGSTLLCDILQQNPKFHASSTSDLVNRVSSDSVNLSQGEGNADALMKDSKVQTDRARGIIRTTIKQHYAHIKSEVVFDKARAWPYLSLLMQDVMPDSKMIVIVRNPCDIAASIERQHRYNAVYDFATTLEGRTLTERLKIQFAADGIVGWPIKGLEDLFMRKMPKIMVQYEKLVDTPKSTMQWLYEKLGEENFEHDFKSVKSTADDIDSRFLNKASHVTKPVVKKPTHGWKEVFDDSIGDFIMQQYPYFASKTGYK